MEMKFDATKMLETRDKKADDVAEGTKSALSEKLLRIMSKIDRVKKNGRNEFQKYDYATEADVLETVRPLLEEEGVLVTSTLHHHYTMPLEKGKVEEKEINTYMTTVLVDYTMEDVESGERRTVRSIGQGCDKGDKGVYKALTGAAKYFLMKTFLIPTGDDPENDNKVGSKKASSSFTKKTKKSSVAKVNKVSNGSNTTEESSQDDGW